MCIRDRLLGVLRCTLDEALHAERLAVFHQAGLGDFVRQIIEVLAFGLDAPLVGDLQELFRILDLVGAALFRLIEQQVPASPKPQCGV